MDGDGSSRWAWPAGLLVVAGLLASVYHFRGPLQPMRPPKPAGVTDSVGEQRVDARLWQDPFEAANGMRERLIAGAGEPDAAKPGGEGIDDLARQIEARMLADREDLPRIAEIRLMPVMVNNTQYAEDKEVRLRTRYALLAGLGVAGFVPADQEHLGTLVLDWQDGPLHYPEALGKLTLAGGGRGKRLIVPYEWFRRAGPPTKLDPVKDEHVLVLWLDNSLFADAPLTRLAQLLHGLRGTRPKLASEWAARVKVSVMGPPDSTTLRAMAGDRLLNGMHRLDAAGRRVPYFDGWLIELRGMLRYVPIWSYRATIVEATIMSEHGEVAPGLAQLTSATGLPTTWPPAGGVGLPAAPRLIRTVPDDGQLVEELLSELKLRGVDVLESGGPAVAFVGEWDTLYGRMLPRTFWASVRTRNPEGPWDQGDRDGMYVAALRQSSLPPHLKHFSYLRGVDGELPADRQKQAERPERSRWEVPRDEWDRSDGTPQFDYMQRLATSLRRWDAELRSNGKDGVRAIGVAGSDVYDKLLVLRTLREQFPHAIFFTTDLDSRLLDPTESRWTRNLVVASGYGLTLAEKLQGRIPPFRDTYQTALFHACLLAVMHPPAAGAPRVPARRFEIGRTRAVDLSEMTGGDIHPPATRDFNWAPVRWSVAGGILASVLVVAMSRRGWSAVSQFVRWAAGRLPPAETAAERVDRMESRCLGWWIVLTALTTVAFVLLVIGLGQSPTRPWGEPVAPFEGVSVWPTEGLRLAATLLACLFLIRAHFAVARNDVEVDASLGYVPTAPTAPPGGGSMYERLGRLFSRSISSWTAMRRPDDVPSLWAEYRDRGQPRRRTERVLFMSALFLALAFVLVKLLGEPHVPFRGREVYWVDRVILSLAILGLTLLTFSVVDATRLCHAFVRRLAGPVPAWPPESEPREVEAEVRNEWLDIRLIAGRTEAVGRMVVYPFVVLVLLVGSRASVFDRWDWPPSLLAIFGINAVLAIAAALFLRRAAEDARGDAVATLSGLLMKRKAAGAAATAQLEYVIAEIKGIRTGAFAPLSHHPVFGAVLIPTGGIGTLTVLDMLMA